MTLKTRNVFTLVFSAFFLALSAAAVLYFAFKLNFASPESAVFGKSLSFGGFSLFSESATTIVFAAFCMALYIPAASFYIYARFEKTPSNETAYFILFLLGCVPELLKLCVALETAANNYPDILIFAGRALFWGRLLCFSSLFAASLMAAQSMKLNAEQNIFVIFLFSMAIASIAPINTTQISSAFYIQTGWSGFLRFYYVLAAVLTAVTYIVKAQASENSICLKLSVFVLMMEAGLLILNSTGILAAAIVGAVFLVAGTFSYFNNLHSLYN